MKIVYWKMLENNAGKFLGKYSINLIITPARPGNEGIV